jgi:PLP dependent protein
MSDVDFSMQVSQIRQNLEKVKSRMRSAADKSDRDLDSIQLIAVTKLLPLKTIKAGVEAGIRRFGENYAEQAAEKITALETDKDIEWHMIGHIQSRKTNTVCEYFDMVHSLDRMKIGRYLDRYSREIDKVMPVLIEVNVSGEDSKYGWQASDEDRWSDLVPQFRQIVDKKNIEVRGLMSMPPLFDDPELTRPIYQRLRRLQEFLRQEIPKVTWDDLSIGTSFDYEVAIQEGATMIRIGTEIFGPRSTA